MEHVIVEFRAGKLVKDDKTLKADSRKGLVRLVKTEDTLLHVMWHERPAAGGRLEAEDDVIVFPQEAQLDKIPGQRAVVLKFPEDATRNLFFWLQEPVKEQDDALVAQANHALSTGGEVLDQAPSTSEPTYGVTPSSALEHAHSANAPTAGMPTGGGPSLGQLPSAPGQLPGSVAPQVSTPGGANLSQASQLAALLGSAFAAGMGQGARPAPGGNDTLARALAEQMARVRGGAVQQAGPDPGPSLSEVLRPEVLGPLLRGPRMLAALEQYLPEEHRNPEALAALAHSPQFHQQLATFSSALQTGQLDLRQFGINAAGYSVADFLQAIQDLVEREGGQGHEGTGGQGSDGASPMDQ